MAFLFPEFPDTSRITVSCSRVDFSASSLARAVEDCDALLLNLNVTAESSPDLDLIVVELRINRRNPAAVCRSLERYGYEVTAVSAAPDDSADGDMGDDADPHTLSMRRRAQELLRYLEM